MPAGQRVAIDSTPSLHGIWDTINATRTSDNPRFRVPRAFYDARTLEIIESIILEEEYVGYKESKEYRTLEKLVRCWGRSSTACGIVSKVSARRKLRLCKTFSVRNMQHCRHGGKSNRSQRFQARARRMSRLDTSSRPSISGRRSKAKMQSGPLSRLPSP